MSKTKIRTILKVSLLLFGMIGSIACKKDVRKADAEKIVAEWVWKTIEFPSDVVCTSLGKDTICPDMNTPYKILVYTDSTGCTSCKLQLYKWNTIIKETILEMQGKVSFHFYFQPKDEEELIHLFKREDFDQVIYWDRAGRLEQLNSLPQEINYRCFLLDKKNKVLLIGNPTSNPAIWELYKQTITGKNGSDTTQNKSVSVVEVENSELELKGLKTLQTILATFTLHNVGDYPLVISDITASCGCTVPEWDKKPVNPGSKTEIRIKVTPDAPGHFRKTINVLCNIKERKLRLIIKGIVEE